MEECIYLRTDLHRRDVLCNGSVCPNSMPVLQSRFEGSEGSGFSESTVSRRVGILGCCVAVVDDKFRMGLRSAHWRADTMRWDQTMCLFMDALPSESAPLWACSFPGVLLGLGRIVFPYSRHVWPTNHELDGGRAP